MTRALPGGEKGGIVELYVDEVARKRAALLASGVEVGEEEFERLHLAHELYHALEFSDGPLTVDAAFWAPVPGRSRAQASLPPTPLHGT